MFPNEPEARDAGVNGDFEVDGRPRERPSLAPPRLPRLSSSLSSGLSFGRAVMLARTASDQSDDLATLSSVAEAQHRHVSSQGWTRGRLTSSSSSDEAPRAELPGVATLMTPHSVRFRATPQAPQVGDDGYYTPSVEQRRLASFPPEHRRTQSSPANHFHSRASSTTAPEPSLSPSTTVYAQDDQPHGFPGRPRRWGSVPLPPSTRLDVLAGVRLSGEVSQRRSSRWTPYPTASTTASRFQAQPMGSLHSAVTYWDTDDAEFEDAGPLRNQRRRRMSPRRRLAASKARAQAWGVAAEGGGELGPPPSLAARGYRVFDARNLSFAATPPSLFVSRSRLPPSLLPPTSLPLGDAADASASTKSSRYLREMDRRAILERLDRGEKQSALAKEFRVTRAAICNLNKQRTLVLARRHEDPLAKHPKKSKRNAGIEFEAEMEGKVDEDAVEDTVDRFTVTSPADPLDKPLPAARQNDVGHSHVHAVALQPAERLLPLLSSQSTGDEAFRHYCDRLMTLVVEETLAWAHAEAHKRLNTMSGGPDKPPTTCGVAVKPQGAPLLAVFRQLEPELPTGSVAMAPSRLSAVLELPPVLAAHTVCLFYAFTDAAGGARVSASIRALLEHGAVEELLCLVTLAVSTLTVDELQRAYPSLRIAAAHVESEAEAETWRYECEHDGLESEEKMECIHGAEEEQHGKVASRLEMLATRVAEVY